VNKRTWSDDDRIEFDLLVTESLAEPKVPVRREVFLSGFDGAIQSQCFWAADVLHDIRETGADRILKNEHDLRRPRVPVTKNGVILGKVPRVLGVRRRNHEGGLEHERMLFDYMTFDELRDKLPWLVQQIEAYERDAHAVIRLLALEKRAPGTVTPAEACEQLGTTIEEWLATEDAA